MPPVVNTEKPHSAVVVLGKKPPGDAEIHPDFAANLRAAAELVKPGKSGLLVISGGATRNGRQPEAQVGHEYLRQRVAVPILLETDSRTTAENIVNVRRLLEPYGIETVTFVTSAYHVRRTRLLVERLWPAVAATASYEYGQDTDRWPERLINVVYLPYAAIDPGNQTIVRFTRRIFRNA